MTQGTTPTHYPKNQESTETRHSWRHNGRNFTLHKQPGSTNWYVTFVVNGKRHHPSLKTSDQDVAVLRAQELWERAVAESFLAPKPKPKPGKLDPAVTRTAGRWSEDGTRWHWRYKGHDFTLHKQPGSPNWYVQFKVNGKRFHPSLKTPDVKVATLRAQSQWEKAIAKSFLPPEPPKPKPAPRVSTLGEVLACYDAHIHTVSEKIERATVTKNITNFRRLAVWAAGKGVEGRRVSRSLSAKAAAGELPPSAEDRLPLTALTASWIDAAVTNYVAVAKGDPVLRDQRRRGIASMVRRGRSIFKRDAMRLYRERGLNVPDLSEFMTQRKVTGPPVNHRSLDPGALREMYDAALELADKDPLLYLVHLAFRHLGMRNCEIDELRVDWFERAPASTYDGKPWGQWFLVVEPRPSGFCPKASHGVVPICQAVMAEFVRILGDRIELEDEPLLGGTTWTRYELLYMRHSEFIRQFLPKEDYRKSSYELRRWASQIMTARYGKDAGEAFLRHAPETVAERHYLERRYPWSNLGSDVGITLEDARGPEKPAPQGEWLRGSAALRSLRSAV